jgi:hypothetical protein
MWYLWYLLDSLKPLATTISYNNARYSVCLSVCLFVCLLVLYEGYVRVRNSTTLGEIRAGIYT